ncbi:putative bifunctional diguanylate cyclase/phosphodiesterase [Thalassotalea profundi]|uniref:EAL domain-containing protein n=1 Tax=Thalassotalea profundi TaxID=2036687 RepID=A0ABQ3ILD8_9GAMM|nr:EAL domain-containing protein [Thalassotalea profundi]GHE84809.1 hypothetical protein GCM10011501_12070 [Thalassotalea profundi]
MLSNVENLPYSENMYRSLFKNTAEAMLLIKENKYIACNKATLNMLGLNSVKNICSIHPSDISPPTQPCGMESEKKAEEMMKIAYENGKHSFEWLHQSSSNEFFLVEVILTVIEYNNEQLLHVVWRDISTYYEMGKRLKITELVFEKTTDAIMVTDQDNIIIDVNTSFTHITGYTKEEAIGNFAGFMKSGVHDKSFYRGMWESINNHGCWKGQIWDKQKSGINYPKTLNISTIKNKSDSVENFIAIFSDSTERLKYEKRIERQANFDSLSGFPNRSLLLRLLEERILMARDKESMFALAFIDIDSFKMINDSKGHAFGDQIITKVMQCINSCIDEDDLLGRMSGDEFLIIFQTDQPLSVVEEKIKKIITFSEVAIPIDSSDFFITLSAGISCFPSDGQDVSSLIANADIAMYHTKQNGGKSYTVYDYHLGRKFQDNNELEEELVRAINDQVITSFYQPKLDLSTGKLVGCESLARWQRSNGKYVPPDLFIEIAEKKHRINQLSTSLFTKTFKSISDMNLPSDFITSVNVSAMVLLDDNFQSNFIEYIHQSGLALNQIEIEITETCLIKDFEKVKSTLSSLRSQGIKIAIDDFGTGFASLNYLTQLDIDTIKIDKSFVGQLDNKGKSNRVIVESIIIMSHKLGYKVVAEGVETISQLEILKELECDLVQGYLISKPVNNFFFKSFINEFDYMKILEYVKSDLLA